MPAIYKGTAATGFSIPPQNGATRRYYQGQVYTSIREGQLSFCQAGLPAVGTTFEGHYVMDSYAEPTTGGLGRSVIITESRNSNYIYEIDWQQIQKPLELHPRYSSGGAASLTAADAIAISLWRVESDPALKAAYHYGTASNTLGADAQDFANKVMAGNESYLVFAPIARRTRIDYLVLTVGSNLGTRSTSVPFAGAPSGYEWLKVTDRARKDGAYWERSEEWLGADAWDAQIYS